MALTIEEIKEKKIVLESAILKLVNSFEDETDTLVSYVDLTRKPKKSMKANDICNHICVPEPERDGPVENINVNMRFDL